MSFIRTPVRLAALLIAVASPSLAAPYPPQLHRRASLGISLEAVPNGGGAVVRALAPGQTGERIGLCVNDVVTEVDGKPVHQPQDLIAYAGTLKEGDPVQLRVRHGAHEESLRGRAQGRPLESYHNAVVSYGAVPFRGGYLEDILVLPKDRPDAPVVFLLPGYSCASIEPSVPDHPYLRLGEELLARGIGYYRVEKPGLGDSVGPIQCSEIDYATELDAFRTAYRTLIETRRVRQDHVFMFGHSLGGLQAPMLAAERAPGGVAVYGTVVRNWGDYHRDLVREQPFLIQKRDPVQMDAAAEQLRPLFLRFFEDRKSPAQIAAEHPAYAATMKDVFQWDGGNHMLGRSVAFLQDLAKLPLVAAWRDSKTKVLTMYGGSDLVALSGDDARYIAEIANHYRPGSASYVEIPNTDHGMLLVGPRETLIANGPAQGADPKFNVAIADQLAAWINRTTDEERRQAQGTRAP